MNFIEATDLLHDYAFNNKDISNDEASEMKQFLIDSMMESERRHEQSIQNLEYSAIIRKKLRVSEKYCAKLIYRLKQKTEAEIIE